MEDSLSHHSRPLRVPCHAFGLTNGLAVFHSMINEIFKDIMDKYVIAYLDDILIYSLSYKDHIRHVCTVYLYVKAEKCEFHRSSFWDMRFLTMEWKWTRVNF